MLVEASILFLKNGILKNHAFDKDIVPMERGKF
jgi:hypothetical protein